MNQNGLSDRILPLAKVKCVLKTTDHAPPLPVNNFYGSKHHCTPMIFFSLFPPKFIRQGQVTGSQSEWCCRLWLSSRFVWLKANLPGNKRNPSDKCTVHGKPSWLSAFSTSCSASIFVSILTRKEIRKKCCNRLRLRARVGVDEIYRLRLRLRSKLPTPADSDSDSDSDFAALVTTL